MIMPNLKVVATPLTPLVISQGFQVEPDAPETMEPKEPEEEPEEEPMEDTEDEEPSEESMQSPKVNPPVSIS